MGQGRWIQRKKFLAFVSIEILSQLTIAPEVIVTLLNRNS